MHRRLVAAPLLAVALAVSACSGGTVTPTPTVEPTPTCTPVLGGTPYPCNTAERDKLAAEEAEYAEAEAVHARFMTDYIEQEVSPTPKVTKAIEETTTPSFRESLRESFEADISEKKRVLSGRPQLAYVKRVPPTVVEGATGYLESCLDASTVRFSSTRGKSNVGTRVRATYFFTRIDGALLIYGTRSDEVDKC